jgi:hypothetical protein
MLERLTEEWTDPTDATINDELEFEKQLWTRTAFHSFFTTDEESRGHRSVLKPLLALSETVKILSLYENHGMLISCLGPFSRATIPAVHPSPPSPQNSIT